MTDLEKAPPPSDFSLPTPLAMSQVLIDIAQRSQRLVSDFLQRQATDMTGPTAIDPLNVGGAFIEMTARMLADPAKLVQANVSLWQDYMTLWQRTTQRLLGQDGQAVAEAQDADRGTGEIAWDENALFDFVKQSYLLTARWLQATVRDVEGLDKRTTQKIDFYTRQFVDAMAPSGFVLTNPEVLRATVESGGDNLIHGLEALLKDLERGKNGLWIGPSAGEAFEVGRDLATTPGKVIYENPLMQVLQYEPTTAEVHRVPLLLMPPWLNKFYVFDLKPKNSLVKWAVDQGHTVLVISWANPDEQLAAKTFEDYVLDGPLRALEVIEQATGAREVNAVGYGLGGTLLAVLLAYMAARGDERIRSASFFATLADFSEPGELSVFINEELMAGLETQSGNGDAAVGADMTTVCDLLRANDLVWSSVVGSYLLGQQPFPFELLFWNSDSTRFPTALHDFYLRHFYQANLLREPGGVTVAGTPIALDRVKTPGFIVAAKEDHIAPWKSAYALSQMTAGAMRFCLVPSGHLAGIVNPPNARRSCYWTQARTPKDAAAFLDGASRHDGSWWPEWGKWLSRFGDGKVPAREPGGRLRPLEDAPGSYVRVCA